MTDNHVSHDLAHIGALLARIERLAEELRADPDGHVRRSVTELRDAFETRAAVEPAVVRVRHSVQMLWRDNHEGARREFQKRSQGLDHLQGVIANELLPHLRRMGFDV
jgi:hypothetical protein